MPPPFDSSSGLHEVRGVFGEQMHQRPEDAEVGAAQRGLHTGLPLVGDAETREYLRDMIRKRSL